MRRPLRTIQPLDMSQPSPNVPLLDLRPRKLLLLLRLEFHIRVVLCARVRRRRRRAADVAADIAGARARVFESVERDGEVAFVRHAAVGDVPLLWTQGADEFFVMGDPRFQVSRRLFGKYLGNIWILTSPHRPCNL